MKILSKINFASIIFAFLTIGITIFFGIIDIIISLTIGPFNKKLKLNFMHYVAMYWGKVLTLLVMPKFNISGIENYDKNKTYIITSNHQSSFDIFFTFYILNGEFCFISKDDYFKMPIIGYAMRGAGYILVKRSTVSAAKMIDDAVARLKSGRSVVLYPEGSRSIDGNIRRPKKGIIKISNQCEDIEILPIVIDGTKNVMKTSTLKIRLFQNINVKFLKPFKFKDIDGDENKKLEYWYNLMDSELKKLCDDN